jgi:hypothetical protein
MKGVLVVLLVSALAVCCRPARAGDHRAPADPPVIDRQNWCVFGTPTRTTGECMCRWSSKDACQGSACQFELGLAWHHYTCLDCACQPKPQGVAGAGANNLRSHMGEGTPVAKRLAELKSLHDLGVIDDEDYKQRKREILMDV